MTEAGLAPTDRSPLISVGLASAAALAYEVLLLRLFSITQWHHTAYMVISLALLGYAASGSVLGWWGEWCVARRRYVYPTALAAAGMAMIACFLCAQSVAVHPEEVLWSPRQIGTLVFTYLLLAVPFLLVATAVGVALMRYRPQSVYASDLLGAGMGGVVVVLFLYVWHPMQVLRAVACLAFLAAWVGAREVGWRSRTMLWLPLLPLALVWFMPDGWTTLEISQYKTLSQLLRVEGAYVAHQRSSPLALITAVESPVVPLRHAPGLSLAARREPAAQVALFFDGDGPAVVTKVGDDDRSLDHLDQMTAALPYHLRPPGSVLVLGAGGGEQVLRASLQGATVIVAVELDRRVIELVAGEYGAFSGHLYEQPAIEVVIADARGFVSREPRYFDLIEHTVAGGGSGQAPGLHALAESYLHTTEAMEAYLDRLAPDGLLAVTGWVTTPARGTIKLVATVLEAMRRRGVSAPERRLAVVRSWQTSTVLVKNGDLSGAEISRLEAFCESRMFDAVFYPQMARGAANRFNRLAEPELHDAVVALLGPSPDLYLRRSKFELSPATDDRPFFHQYFRWRSLLEILSLRGRGGLPLLEAGYLILLVTLLQGLVASLLLVGFPAWLRSHRAQRTTAPSDDRPPVGRVRVVLYFSGLGLGFLLLEVAFLQRFILFLHHPVLAAAVVLASFLLFAGLGSAAAGRWAADVRGRVARWAMVLIGVLGLLALVGSGLSAVWLAGAPTVIRVAAAIGLIAPLAFVMGMPFPLGLDVLRQRAPTLVPWAWGVNGCASVVSPVLATLLAVHLGFTSVILLALAIYWATTLVFPDPAL